MSAPQGSQEWLSERLGKATASRISDVVARTKTGYGASRANYLAELVAERLTGIPAERYVNGSMQWGTEKEPEARALYAFVAGAEVSETGFWPHPSIDDAGASPDGLVSVKGLVEIKCPGTAKHIETLLSSSIDGKYVLQMQWQMACTGCEWTDFVSYDPRLPSSMQLFVQRVQRNETLIAELEAEVRIFLEEVANTVARLKAAYGESSKTTFESGRQAG